MATTEAGGARDALTPEELSEMERHGITRFPVYYFRLGAYRYSNLRDALAAARRQPGAG